ncbi:MAG: potassium transporter TrkH [Rhodothermaceae bacterium]|nr:MAG: potassium transporter TrkH [Rhodothermaceae bacterium]
MRDGAGTGRAGWRAPWRRLRGAVRAAYAWWRARSPSELFVYSFLLLVGLGTLGLKTLPGLYTGAPLDWLDALFTATSAVCVTGLIVVDTATYFTTAGQAFLLLLIQLGGLGMITLATLIILSLGQRASLRQEALMAGSPRLGIDVGPARLTRIVVVYTLLIEATGALLLYLLWLPDRGWTGAAWPAVFHAVSAFCNAGFSTFSDSLVGEREHPLVLLVIMALIVLGGLGFLVMEELVYHHRQKRRGVMPRRVSVHTRLVLGTTAVLIVAGWVLFTVFEWGVSLADLPPWARIVNGLFMSVTPRTAGFNTVDYAGVSDSGNFLTILLMAVGGSPGSTAGGFKTTTVALIGLLALANLRGASGVHLAGRTVPDETIRRAVGLFVLVFGVMTAAVFVMVTTHVELAAHAQVSGRFLVYMFEVVSAFNTVGLTMGGTPELTGFGKGVIILLMFIGRVGPMTFAAALARRRRLRAFRYAHEDVIIG